MIKLDHVTKIYGDVTAVNNVGFSARNGEITTLLGANGSGKSTTLKAIAGLIRPQRGRIRVDNIDVTQDKLRARQRIGFFPDQFGLYPRLTTKEHIAYFGRFHGLNGKEMQQSISDVSDLLEISDILDRKTDGFSQGQRMKVALARTLVHKPDNLILDEPMRGLDTMSVRLVRSVLKALRADGKAILFSSHVLTEVERLSDRVVIIRDGKLVADDTPEGLIKTTQVDNLEDAFVKLIHGKI